MPRLGIVRPLFLSLATGVVASSASAQTAPSCDLRLVRAVMSDSEIGPLVSCQYDDIRTWLPSFTTVNWVVNNRVSAGTVLRQSAPRGTQFSQLQNEFTLWVSAGPRVSVSSATALAGRPLSFTLNEPLAEPRPYVPRYLLALDPKGEAEARAGTDYASVDDEGFFSGGALEVNTLAGRAKRLYVIVGLSYPPEGSGFKATLGRGAGRILPYPRISLSASSANEGSILTFTAHIDRSYAADEPFTYRFGLRGNAVRGVDYVAPSGNLLTFPAGEDTARLSIQTRENKDILDDRLLILAVAAPDQKPAIAQGTIINTTVAPTSSPTPTPTPRPTSSPTPTPTPTPASSPSPTPTTSQTPSPAPTPAASGTQVATPVVSGTPTPTPSPTATDGPGLWPLISEWGEGWLAAIGVLAIGAFAGFLFGRKKPNGKRVNQDSKPDLDPTPVLPITPIFGWSAGTPGVPALKGALAVDGPAITIGVEAGQRSAGHLASLPILAEGPSDE